MSKKKTISSKVLDFLTGRNRNPNSIEIASALMKGKQNRRKIIKIYKEQEEIIKKRIEIETLFEIVNNSKSSCKERETATAKLKKLLEI